MYNYAMLDIGVSFSLHRCSELGVDKKKLLKAAIQDLGFRRFRLMSYWNIHEQMQGVYNFSELDWQMDMIAEAGGTVTLCLGKRQPRWPECHMPKWAQQLPKKEWYQALFDYNAVVVKRYKDHPALESWQLENEALLKDFGYCVDGDYSHARLQKEYNLIKQLDQNHPVIMTLSDSWGLPIRGPKPDQYAMSLYRITINQNGEYAYSKRSAWFYKIRRELIRITKFRQTFIHEMQAEPWLKKTLLEVPIQEQLKYMNPKILEDILIFSIKTGSNTIDLWGLEWWYWLKQNNHPELWDAISKIDKTSKGLYFSINI